MKKIILMCVVGLSVAYVSALPHLSSPSVPSVPSGGTFGGGGSHGPVISAADMSSEDHELAAAQHDANAAAHQAHAKADHQQAAIHRKAAKRKQGVNIQGNKPQQNPLTGGYSM